MTRLSFPAYRDHLRAESARFREVLADCDPEARVPACPDWDAGDLLWHLADVQWFWATRMRLRPAAPTDDLQHPDRPDSYAGLLEAFDTHSRALVSELEQADPSEPAWSWAPEQTVGFTFRRQAHEALIHRLDAEQAASVETALDPALATDGVAELLDVMYGGEAPAWGRIEPGRHRVRIDLVDTATSLWAEPCQFVGTDPESGKNYDGPHVLLVPDPGTEPSAVIAGAAGDLDTWLWKRSDESRLALSGDEAALLQFREAVNFPLD
ncbi:MAG: maleylpyruvate isomerase family mycothiol-dependent enzyme [Nocardioides sp.]